MTIGSTLYLQAAAVAGVTGSPWGDIFVSQGPMGIISGFLLYVAYTLWNENKKLRDQVDAEKNARLTDANAARDMLLQMGEKVHQTTDKFADIADRLEKNR